jgi:DNA polymerase III epsilon subunit-like protein
MSTGIQKIIVLDTETNGFPKSAEPLKSEIREKYAKSYKGLTKKKIEEAVNKRLHTPEYFSRFLELKPYIIQFSYIKYEFYPDADESLSRESFKIYDKYIDTDNVEISPEASAVHHITSDVLKSMKPSKKTSIEKALEEFIADAEDCDLIIGHNIRFDIDRIKEALERIRLNASLWKRLFSSKQRFYRNGIATMNIGEKQYCTMLGKTEKDFCKLTKTKGDTYKNPSLKQLYYAAFGYEPNDLHNSLVDIITCLRAYMLIHYQIDVYGRNRKITKWIDRMFYSKFAPCVGASCMGSVSSSTSSSSESSQSPEITCTGETCDFFGVSKWLRGKSRSRSKGGKTKSSRKTQKNKLP